MSAPVLCVIPGLIWPGSGLADILSSLTLPGLSDLFAQVRGHHAPPCSLDAWLAGRFGLADDVPFAALRLAGEQALNAEDKDTLWVCADPVSLRFARQHLLLDSPENLSLDTAEMDALLADLNKSFADIGRFHCTRPEHCYLALDATHADKLRVKLAPLADVESRPVSQFQPQGEQTAWWSRLANELQVFCHNHPVNTAREARGAAPLNALWLWGAGRLPAAVTPPSAQIATRLRQPYYLLAGLARLADMQPAEFDPGRPAAWALIDDLHAAAQQRDAARWATALQTLDAAVCVPLSQALRNGTISALHVVAPGDTTLAEFDITRVPRWKFWQRSAGKTQLLAQLASPDA